MTFVGLSRLRSASAFGSAAHRKLPAYLPQGPGHSSVGVRINHVSYFKGAVMRARFAPRAGAVGIYESASVARRGAVAAGQRGLRGKE